MKEKIISKAKEFLKTQVSRIIWMIAGEMCISKKQFTSILLIRVTIEESVQVIHTR
jgi:hypothetical protein